MAGSAAYMGRAGGEPDPVLPARPVHPAPFLPSRLRIRGPDRVLREQFLAWPGLYESN